MFERIVSRPLQTAFVAVEIEVSCDFSVPDDLELLADGGERGADGRGVDLDLVLDERGERQQPRQPDGGLERRRLRIVRDR